MKEAGILHIPEAGYLSEPPRTHLEKGEKTMKRLTAFVLLLILVLTSLVAAAGSESSAYPEKPIAYMNISFKCGCTRIGTGAMVCVDGLLTAGHNLICEDHSQPADQIDFYFGYISKNEYFYRYNGHFHYWYMDNFKKGYRSKYDIGYVRFDENIGEKTGWLGTRYAPDNEFSGKVCSIKAYSSDGTLTEYSAQISLDGKLQFSLNQKELPYGGEGAPVCVYRNGKPFLVAVYNSHTKKNCLARRLTKDLFDEMKTRLTFNR